MDEMRKEIQKLLLNANCVAEKKYQIDWKLLKT